MHCFLKKGYLFILVAVVVLSLSACGGEKEAEQTMKVSEETAEEKKKTKTEDEAGAEKASEKEESEKAPQTLSADGQVVVDKEKATVVITDVEVGENPAVLIKGIVENRTDELMNYFVGLTFNGSWQYEPDLFLYLESGETGDFTISISQEEVGQFGITSADQIRDIELTSYVSASDDVSGNSTATIYHNDNAATVTDEKIDGQVVVDREDFKMVAISNKIDLGDYNIEVYLENKTDNPIDVYVQTSEIDGISCSASMHAKLAACGKQKETIVWHSFDLEDAQIDPEGIQEVTIDLIAYDSDTSGENVNILESFRIDAKALKR